MLPSWSTREHPRECEARRRALFPRLFRFANFLNKGYHETVGHIALMPICVQTGLNALCLIFAKQADPGFAGGL
jgi:hypothetical protein